MDYIVLIMLLINYGKVINNISKRAYKNNFKDLLIDLFCSYYLAPLITISIIWDYSNKRKNSN